MEEIKRKGNETRSKRSLSNDAISDWKQCEPAVAEYKHESEAFRKGFMMCPHLDFHPVN